jgi:hypothetical protein
MKMRSLALATILTVIAGVVSLSLATAAGQTSKTQGVKSAALKSAAGSGGTQASSAAAWPKHRPDGQPDVQGYWVAAVYGMSCLKNPTRGVGCFDAQDGPADPRRPPQQAASRIIDTPDGEIPYQPWARQHQQYLLSNYFEPTKPEFIDPQQLCLPLGPVRQFTWHDAQIIQYDGYLLFEHEGGHVYQIVPLDGRPHASSKIKLWMGDSRGHWEGNTLVIDVSNENAKGRLSRAGDFSSDKVHNTVRIKFLDANHARFEAVFDDPSTYTRPWTFGFDLNRGIFGGGAGTKDQSSYEQWEEACHEGVHDIDQSLRSDAGNAAPLQK